MVFFAITEVKLFWRWSIHIPATTEKGGIDMRYLMAVCMIFLFPGMVLGASGSLVTYRIHDKTYEGYFIRPHEQAPLVLLIHDWDGLTDYEIKRADMLSEAGYAVFAADLFGAGVRPTEIADRRRLTGELYQDRETMRALMRGALKEAAGRGAHVRNAVAMGYCFGGAAVLELARSGEDLKGFVSFHGGLETPEGQNYAETRGQLLILHGTADAAVSMDEFANLAKEMEAHKVPHEMISYGGADHAFTVFDGDRYQEAADTKSWKRFLEFLTDVLH